MTISALSGSSWSTVFSNLISAPTSSHRADAAVASSGAAGLGMVQDGDAEAASLTNDDRAMIAKLTKVTIHDDGSITFPADIDGPTFAATLEAAKVLAHGRATGTITGATNAGAFAALVNAHRKAITANMAASGITNLGIDLMS